MGKTNVMWFRRDLRVFDNIALARAIENSNKILFVFHIDTYQLEKQPTVNQSSFFASVQQFKKHLKEQNIDLQIFYGELKDMFDYIKKQVPNWHDLYFNCDEHGYGSERDQDITKYCQENLHIRVHAAIDYNLHSAYEIKKPDGHYYQVFTPYFKRWMTLVKPKPIAIDLASISQEHLAFSTLEQDTMLSGLIYEQHSYAYDNQIGEGKARQVLSDFIENKLAQYDQNRDVPSLNATSHLSRYLRTGEISIRTVYEAVRQSPDSDGRATFIKELCWRDYYNMIYATHPQQNESAIRPEFRQVRWRDDKIEFDDWQTGHTGFPIVDAAMRQLNATGWMHNRLRMVVASFLTKDLLINWQWGEAYFKQKLVDYDPASNIGGWQWAASTGTDSVPYFRIFNPTLQSKKFDPDGLFIKKYVPELKDLPSTKIHEPSKLSLIEQRRYQVTIGHDYPKPIVDHKMARISAIAAYEQSKANSEFNE
ncbi:cryptochrome/photolyase family protein [Leuconostoc rapi]|uniref:cryptochrome/photolyase family protein n=1 Tax=Leuconostoc rapi TaxID=1406906 RepID=UPI001C7D89E1|nr:deoxyribodipyrimidine photo-lyase [Leuconostoc rapi]MBM7435059.1 deoxyribodipyrimidine photo-lyase [Leuconostoc rapi]